MTKFEKHHIGLQKQLGITDCEELFTTRKALVHYTSALRYPVFINGKNYSGRTPKMLKEPLLRNTIEQYLGKELRQLSTDTLWVMQLLMYCSLWLSKGSFSAIKS